MSLLPKQGIVMISLTAIVMRDDLNKLQTYIPSKYQEPFVQKVSQLPALSASAH